MNNDDPFAPYFTGGFNANALVAWAFRNGPLEDLHAGVFASVGGPSFI